MRDTQLTAYQDLQTTVSAKRMAVFHEIVESQGATLFELVNKLGWPVNRISGRVTELCKLGLVEDSGWRKVNPETKKQAIIWQPKTNFQMELIKV